MLYTLSHRNCPSGEKPYVCEICERAFARRDKLVMHMNKLKHLTPSNIAPLGKRHHPQSTSSMSGLPEKRQEIKLEVSTNQILGGLCNILKFLTITFHFRLRRLDLQLPLLTFSRQHWFKLFTTSLQ